MLCNSSPYLLELELDLEPLDAPVALVPVRQISQALVLGEVEQVRLDLLQLFLGAPRVQLAGVLDAVVGTGRLGRLLVLFPVVNEQLVLGGERQVHRTGQAKVEVVT